MFGTSGPSLADIAAVTGNRNNDNGFWGGDGIWAIIILFALFGWGGFGGGFGGNGGVGSVNTDFLDAAIQRGFDNQTVINKLDGINSGICALGYDQQAQLNGINTTIMQTGWNLQNAAQQNAIAAMQQTNALQAQLQDCCCENRAAIAQVRYDMATDTCAVTTAIQNAARDIIDNDNCNYRAIQDKFCQLEMAAKDEKIAEQAAIINSLNLQASQQAQNVTLINALRPAPVPAYNVPNPYAYNGSFGGCGCGQAFVGC